MEALLTVDHLRVKYGDFTAVSDVSLTLAPGKVVSLIGANGAGKSSLLGAIAGLLPVAAGRVIFRGEDITALPLTARAKKGIGYAFQQPPRFKGLTVRRLLSLASGRRLPEKIHRKDPLWL